MEAKDRLGQEYIASNGRNNFRRWFEDLKNLKVQAKVDIRIARLRLGNFGDVKSIGRDVFKLRFKIGSGYRIYYGLDGDKIVLLLCGGDKKSQKADIKLAKRLWENCKEERQWQP